MVCSARRDGETCFCVVFSPGTSGRVAFVWRGVSSAFFVLVISKVIDVFVFLKALESEKQAHAMSQGVFSTDSPDALRLVCWSIQKMF
jgi:hypothetical protein